MPEIPIYLRIGDLGEYCIGSISLDPSEQHVRHQVTGLLQGTAAIIREEASGAEPSERVSTWSPADATR